MSKADYYRLVIEVDAGVEIWLGDDVGYFVLRETGTLDTRLRSGRYTVECGLGTRRRHQSFVGRAVRRCSG
jgi:hypothetical protein